MKKKIIFLGTPEYSLPSLKALHEQHEVVAVLSQPDKKAGRGQKWVASPVSEWSRQQGLLLFLPETLKGNIQLLDDLKGLAADYLCCVAYGHILPKDFLSLPKIAALNAHASKLPEWRGAAPINHALLNGQEQFTVTLQKMSPLLDQGAILWQKSIWKHQAEYSEVYKRLSEISAEGFLAVTQEEFNPSEQGKQVLPYAPKITKNAAYELFQKNPKQSLAQLLRGLGGMSSLWIKVQDQEYVLLQVEEQIPKLIYSVADKKNSLYFFKYMKQLYLQVWDQNYRVHLLKKPGKGLISGSDFLNAYFPKDQNTLEVEIIQTPGG